MALELAGAGKAVAAVSVPDDAGTSFPPTVFQARVEVFRAIRPLKSAALLAVAILFLLGGVANLVRGNVFGLCCFIVTGLACAAYRNSAAGHVQKTVTARVSVQDDVLSLVFVGARLFDGVYVDQRYAVARDALEAAWCEQQGSVHLRAKVLQSEAWRGAEPLSGEQREYAEVTFTPDSSGLEAVREALRRIGCDMTFAAGAATP